MNNPPFPSTFQIFSTFSTWQKFEETYQTYVVNVHQRSVHHLTFYCLDMSKCDFFSWRTFAFFFSTYETQRYARFNPKYNCAYLWVSYVEKKREQTYAFYWKHTLRRLRRWKRTLPTLRTLCICERRKRTIKNAKKVLICVRNGSMQCLYAYMSTFF